MGLTSDNAIDIFNMIYVLPAVSIFGMLVFIVAITLQFRKERDEVQIIKAMANTIRNTIVSYIICNVIIVSFRYANHASIVAMLPSVAVSIVSLTGNYHKL